MDERLNQYLDGELSRDDLTADEAAKAAAFEKRVAGLRGALDSRSAGDVDARVMKRIGELGLQPLPAGPAVAFRRALASLFTAHEVRLRWRPAYGLAAAVLAALLIIPKLGSMMSSPQRDAQVAAPVLYVQFRLLAGDASTVTLAGSFSGWRPDVPMQRTEDGVWTVLVPLAPGVHDYAFIVDGQRWVPDPYAPHVDDGFGGTNSRLTLLAPQT